MNCRTAVAGIALAFSSVLPLSGVAFAQDLNCIDFRYQEDAQAEFNRDPSDPNRLDEDRGLDDQIACEWLPRRSTASPQSVAPTATPQSVAPTATPELVNPTSTTRPASPSASPTAVPSRGSQGGLGGASTSTDDETGFGLALAIGGAAGAVGYTLTRRRRH
ncbi:excalibur calcium-binding protein [Streptomyces sp. NBC_00234]|uniref:excalibur calcium-binding protein n=1 Tax=Streptomyces sp. NBC_00234 TaxID=2903638 RepID=UPI002E2D093E|nr:excalibur calcium-binding protein [Streptomyces sp. NBC_00234]